VSRKRGYKNPLSGWHQLGGLVAIYTLRTQADEIEEIFTLTIKAVCIAGFE